MVADIRSEWWPASNRNRWLDCLGIRISRPGGSKRKKRKYCVGKPVSYINNRVAKPLRTRKRPPKTEGSPRSGLTLNLYRLIPRGPPRAGTRRPARQERESRRERL